MRKIRMGGLEVRLTGGTDGDGGGEGAMVVLLHGYGAPGDDLVALGGALDAPSGTRFAFPEAPLELPVGYGVGRAWWHIDMVRLQRMLQGGGNTSSRDTRDVPDGIVSAREKVMAMLDEIDRTLAPSRIVIGGFSQGAMLACDVALRTERALAGLVLLSGTIVCEDEWTPLMPNRRGLPVFQSHGASDPLLPMEVAERLKNSLIAAGADLRWTPFRGAHEIPRPVLEALRLFLKEVLA